MLGNETERRWVFETLDAMREIGADVARTWAFLDGDESSYDGRSTQPRRGEFNERAFVGLDEVLYECERRRIRVILTLTNYWDDYGGIARYARWAREEGETSAYRREDFFTSPKCRDAFEAFVAKVVTRTNTFTNVAYKDDPTIFAYQLINEPRLPGDDRGDVFHEWATYFGALVKRLDEGNHLVSVGTEGFFMRGEGVEANPFAGAERQGVDVDRLRESDAVDFVAAHVWTDDWMDSDDESKLRFLERWIRAHLAKSANDKPIVFEEFGKKRPLAVRDAYFARTFELLREDDRRRAGALFWLLSPAEIEDYDGFTVYDAPSDASTLNIVRREIESKAAFFRGEGVDACCAECACAPPPARDDGDTFNDDDTNDDDIVIEFPDDGNDEIYVDAPDEIESFACRMATSNAYEAHATYGDYVSIELDIETKVPIDVFADFITPRERMSPTSVRTTTNKDGDWRFASTFVATRRLGDDGVYVDEGPLRFRIDVVPETTPNERTFFVEGVTEGVTVVFDSTRTFARTLATSRLAPTSFESATSPCCTSHLASLWMMCVCECAIATRSSVWRAITATRFMATSKSRAPRATSRATKSRSKSPPSIAPGTRASHVRTRKPRTRARSSSSTLSENTQVVGDVVLDIFFSISSSAYLIHRHI